MGAPMWHPSQEKINSLFLNSSDLIIQEQSLDYCLKD